ncbi:MAG TPA: 2-amino-4-hydroxy-6-hydroxymethyldihydropteridine diphosphokinase [Pusillimonas sp.]|uniref:2-amino-4-hydroxy-6- hydroxymethyldihydropteridine diphosphokinase n=1 Tax=Pusillimonas sp. TaxID=3040095 RepID=UPI002C4838C7|nr:2-amino-4-hydroxy-6-hydroxymethyldihydropteridine diphosphokinase [Pusillimonas sp.]HUH88337.1 2-amino-4-hydroxy-6-hydroxymethyldihydropteridine diphosphokinase [Pusillimonas sp.]
MVKKPESGEPQWVTAYIGLGANLGDAQATLLMAAQRLAQTQGVRLFELSPLYRTAPIDSSGPYYINAVAALQTRLCAHELLDALQALEQQHGRERPYRNAPRTLDLDLLLYGDDRIETERLTVPHPRMHQRAFVLRPLFDLAPDLQLEGKKLTELLKGCADQELEALS